jgi:hypothetical protein
MIAFAMAHGFADYRIFIAAPGDLDPDRQVCQDVIANVNETTAMPAKVLLVTVCLRENSQLAGFRSAVTENVRWSSYFVQLFQDDWGERDLYRKLFLSAVEFRGDQGMPMRDIVVCLKDAPHERNQDILAFRRELQELKNIRLIRYGTVEELKTQFMEVCSQWARESIERAQAVPVQQPPAG